MSAEHQALYMQRSLPSQDNRRQAALELQKQRRADKVNYARRLAQETVGDSGADDDDSGAAVDIAAAEIAIGATEAPQVQDDAAMQQDGSMVDAVGTEQSSSDAMEASSAVASGGKSSKGKKAKSFVANISARRPQYTNQLMLSETMESVPGDLVSEWTCVLCPKGVRSLVTSSSGKTIARSKSGQVIASFDSLLPGGSRRSDGNHATDYCILDCVYDASTSTFHVLDLMCWRGHPVYDCTTEFRYFWLQSKLSEVAVGQRSRANPMAFVPAPTAACDGPSLSQLVAAASSLPYESDGVLFVHKHAFYTVGVTPLSLWLKADAVVPMMASFFTVS